MQEVCCAEAQVALTDGKNYTAGQWRWCQKEEDEVAVLVVEEFKPN